MAAKIDSYDVPETAEKETNQQIIGWSLELPRS